MTRRVVRGTHSEERKRKLRESDVAVNKAGIATLLQTSGFSIAKILAIQSRVQSIVPAGQREPDHILVIMREIGEHLEHTEPMFKDWRKAGDKTESEIDWGKAAEELSDVLILEARALVMMSEYATQAEETYLRADLMDVPNYLMVNDAPTAGQLLLSSVMPFHARSADFRERVASLYFLGQYASMMPFGVGGLRAAWEQKIVKVIRRDYITVE